MELSSSKVKTRFTMGRRATFANLMLTSVLAMIAVASFAALMTKSEKAGCRHLTIDPDCWIQRCKDFADIQCNSISLNITANEFDQFHAGACWSHTENTSCSITQRVDNKELYHLEYTDKECGKICKAFM